MSAIRDLVERLESIDAARLPEPVREAVRQRLFDTLGAYALGASSKAADVGRRLLQTPLGHSLEDAITYTCAVTRSTEVDDIYIPGCATEGSIVVPVAVLLALQTGAEDALVLRSIVAGYEAMSAMARGINGAIVIYEGIWTTYFTAPIGAAAVAACLLGLTAEQTAHALAIAVSRCVGIAGRIVSPASSRSYTAGRAASDGYSAARAAAVGMVGDLHILEPGLLAGSGVTFDAAAFAAHGRTWAVQQVDTKPYRSGRQGLSAMEAYLSLAEVRAPESLEAVTVHIPRQIHTALVPPPGGLRQALSQTLAYLTYDREHVWRSERAGGAPRPETEALAQRIRVEDDEWLSSQYPSRWGARVEVRCADGRTAVAEVLDPPGSERNPFGWDDLLDKYRRLLGQGAVGATPPTWLVNLRDKAQVFGSAGARSSGALWHLVPGTEEVAAWEGA